MSKLREALLSLWERGDEDDKALAEKYAQEDEILLQALNRRKI